MEGNNRSTLNITIPNRNWVSTNTLGDDDIFNYGQNLLDSPEVVMNLSEDKVRLYSEKQMLQMFRLGFNTKSLGPYKLLGKMAVGDTAIFPYECWGSLRNAVCSLQKKYEKTFSIKKQASWGKRGNILVTRNS